MTAPSATLDRYMRQAVLADAAADIATGLWSQVQWDSLVASWNAVADQAYASLAQAQLEAATGADGYVDDVLSQLDVDGGDPAGSVDPMSFAGVASDGRPLDSLLAQPMLQVLDLAGRGVNESSAMGLGGYLSRMIAGTQVADAGRVATGTAITSRPKLAGYVRHLQGASCGRCAVLAGRHYRWSAGFQRHPHCDCINVPVTKDVAAEHTSDPKSYFESLSPADQDKYFGVAAAQSIRDGADIGQVVNASRSMYTTTAGSRAISATREGVTARGQFGQTGAGRTLGGLRLTPEQIYIDAHGDRDLAVSLLQRFGYLTTS